MLSAQYLVNCLEEDHASHGITIQEPRPRPMKETLHSRHHSTVLPRLGSGRMESHQNLNTHAVDSAIQLQGHNRVQKKCPPPISDEEQRLNRRQRCTLSQLRSGHCHLLHDYKHRVLGEPSDICTDCGASPQDVRHLFACTTHPTDLSPEDLWRNPVRSIRAFSYLDNGNIADLTTDLVVANNNNSTHHLFNCSHIRTTFSPLDLWTDPAGVTALLARWTEKLDGGPQAGTSDSPTNKGHGSR